MTHSKHSSTPPPSSPLADVAPLPVAEGHNRSFGRLSSRLSPARQHTLAERLAPYTLPLPATGTVVLPPPATPLVLEIGMGNGALLLHRALHEPHSHFVGVEVFKNGLQSLVGQLEKQAAATGGKKVANLQLSCADGRQVMACLPNACLDMLMVCYPDPWPKKKHHKRRIITAAFVAEAARLLKPGGELFLATDIPDYAMWMLREVAASGAFAPVALGPAEWAHPPGWWCQTKYETKAFKAGRKPWYMRFVTHTQRNPTFHKCEALV